MGRPGVLERPGRTETQIKSGKALVVGKQDRWGEGLQRARQVQAGVRGSLGPGPASRLAFQEGIRGMGCVVWVRELR